MDRECAPQSPKGKSTKRKEQVNMLSEQMFALVCISFFGSFLVTAAPKGASNTGPRFHPHSRQLSTSSWTSYWLYLVLRLLDCQTVVFQLAWTSPLRYMMQKGSPIRSEGGQTPASYRKTSAGPEGAGMYLPIVNGRDRKEST